MRCFVAIPIPQEQSGALEALQDELPVGRRVSSDGFHITLAFLDNQPASVLAALSAELGQIRMPAFDVELRGVDIFGGSEPRLIWAGVRASEPLEHIRAQVRQIARDVGIDLPRERFRPHVTLARFPRRMHPSELAKIGEYLVGYAGFSSAAFEVRSFTIYQSTLTEDGAFYTPISDFEFC